MPLLLFMRRKIKSKTDAKLGPSRFPFVFRQITGGLPGGPPASPTVCRLQTEPLPVF
jgi:hypothetical protein